MVNPAYVPDEKRIGVELKQAKRQAREAQRPTGTERTQVLKKLQEAVDELASIVHAIPITDIGQASASGFGVGTAWATVGSLQIATPAGKTGAKVLAVGGVRVPWSSGGSWPIFGARAVIDGVAGPVTQLSGSVNAAESLSGTATGTFQASLTRTGTGPVVVEIQVAITAWLTGSGPASVSGASADVSALATFNN